MFGLLKHASPQLSDLEKQQARLHYCGTCKTLGSRYGQAARLTLNSDVVFLAEILSAVRNESVQEWHKALHAYNCFRQPGRKAALPASLEYAAALNMVLAGMKIKDNQHDSRNPLWYGLNRFFRSPYRRARRFLQQQQAPVQKWEACAQELLRREKLSISGEAATALDYYARPMALLTGMAMRYGVQDNETARQLFRTGYYFGKLIYLLDAWRDRETDASRRRFNPLFGITGHFSETVFEKEICAIQQKMEDALRILPLPANRQAYLIAKLHTGFSVEMHRLNFTGQLYHACSCSTEKLGFKARVEKARAAVQTIKQLFRPATHTAFFHRLQLKYIVPLIAFCTVFVHPATAAVAGEKGSGGSAATWLWLLAAGAAGKCCNTDNSSNNKDCKCKCCSESCCGKKS